MAESTKTKPYTAEEYDTFASNQLRLLEDTVYVRFTNKHSNPRTNLSNGLFSHDREMGNNFHCFLAINITDLQNPHKRTLLMEQVKERAETLAVTYSKPYPLKPHNYSSDEEYKTEQQTLDLERKEKVGQYQEIAANPGALIDELKQKLHVRERPAEGHVSFVERIRRKAEAVRHSPIFGDRAESTKQFLLEQFQNLPDWMQILVIESGQEIKLQPRSGPIGQVFMLDLLMGGMSMKNMSQISYMDRMIGETNSTINQAAGYITNGPLSTTEVIAAYGDRATLFHELAHFFEKIINYAHDIDFTGDEAFDTAARNRPKWRSMKQLENQMHLAHPLYDKDDVAPEMFANCLMDYMLMYIKGRAEGEINQELVKNYGEMWEMIRDDFIPKAEEYARHIKGTHTLERIAPPREIQAGDEWDI